VSQPPLHLGQDLNSRELFLLQLQSWDDWPRELALPSAHFCLLLAGNAQRVSAETLSSLADTVLTSGCAYPCAWGPDCERVHDGFDLRLVERNIADETLGGPVVVTTWHGKESLDSAMTFLTRDAFPDDAFVPTCRSSVIAVVDEQDWVAEVRLRWMGE
jgi:hypothetical protein